MNRTQRILQHIAFWILYGLLLSLAGGLYDLNFSTSLLNRIFSLPLTISFSYLFVYGILPYFFQKQWLLFGHLTILALASTVILKRLSVQYIQYPLLYEDLEYTFTFLNWYRMAGYSVQLTATAGVLAGLHYFRAWRRSRDQIQALDAEKRAAELSFLRAQVHPHFLFNTLNSIYYEALKKSDQAPDLIIKLSGLLRYILYECTSPTIPIEKELELIRNYIALEKSRYADRLTVDLQVEGPLSGSIPPLLCFSLVENAFKHGTSDMVDHSQISISVKIQHGTLVMTVDNPIAEAQQPDTLGASKGIGLENVRRQLDLLFEDTYLLKTKPENGRFLCILRIPVS